MTAAIVLGLIGFAGTFCAKAGLVRVFLKKWIDGECKSQGPGYIHRHYMARLGFMVAVTMALLLVFVVLDVAWFSKKGIVLNVTRKLSLTEEWGDLGVVAWPLWFGMAGGLIFGAVAGLYWAVYGDLKCRRVLPFLPIAQRKAGGG